MKKEQTKRAGGKKPKKNLRRLKYGSMATVMTVVFIAAVVLVNVIVSLVQDRLPTVDLTTNNIYQLTEDSAEYAKNLDEAVDIIVCYPEEDLIGSTYGKQIVEIIKDYAKQNSKIKVQFVNLLEHPEISTEYADYGVTNYSIIIRSEKRVKVTNLDACLDSTTDQTTQKTSYQSIAEQVMTSAIMYVTEDSVMKAVVLTGHSEDGCEGLSGILTANNYEVSELNIVTEDIPEDADMLCIYAPTTDYSEAELSKLDAFLDNGSEFNKTVVYVASYNQPELPNLASFLAEWGIRVESGLLVETNTANVYDAQGFLFQSELNAESEKMQGYTENMRDAKLPYLSYYSRPLSLEFTESSNRYAEFLTSSPSTTVVYPTENNEDFDINKAKRGSYGTIALGSRVKYEGTDKHSSYVLVYGSTGDFAANLLSSSNYNNNELNVSIINGLMGKENGVNIIGVTFDAESLNITAQTYYAIFLIFLILVPLATLLAGLVVFIRRRNK